MEEAQFEDAEVEYIGLKFEKEKLNDGSDEDYHNDDMSDEGYDEDYLELKLNGEGRRNQQSAGTSVKNFQPAEKLFKKFTHKINVDKYEGPSRNVMEHQNKKDDKVRQEGSYKKKSLDPAQPDPRILIRLGSYLYSK